MPVRGISAAYSPSFPPYRSPVRVMVMRIDQADAPNTATFLSITQEAGSGMRGSGLVFSCLE